MLGSGQTTGASDRPQRSLKPGSLSGHSAPTVANTAVNPCTQAPNLTGTICWPRAPRRTRPCVRGQRRTARRCGGGGCAACIERPRPAGSAVWRPGTARPLVELLCQAWSRMRVLGVVLKVCPDRSEVRRLNARIAPRLLSRVVSSVRRRSGPRCLRGRYGRWPRCGGTCRDGSCRRG